MKKEQKIEILQDLIQIKSVNGKEADVAAYLKQLFDRAGVKNRIVTLDQANNRANLIAEIGSGQPTLAVSGHMDVVAVDPDQWDTAPFDLTKKGDKLYGRGATDMKAGLAALVIAMIELQEEHATIPGTIRLLATAGEEVGQPGAELLQQKGYLNDIDALLIGEPSGYFRTIFANKGELDITLNSQGKSAHSSMPHLGTNAVENLLDILNQIKKRIKELTQHVYNDVLGETVFNIDIFKGGNQVNAIPGFAQAQLNLRTIPELSNQQIIQSFQDIVDHYNQTNSGQISMSVDMNIIPILGKRNSNLMSLIHKIATPYAKQQKLSNQESKQLQQEAKAAGIADYQKLELIKEGISGGTDASKFLVDRNYGFPYVVYGPGNDTPHQDNEYVSEKMFLNFIEIYKELFSSYGA